MAKSDDTKHRPGQSPLHLWIADADKKALQAFANDRGQSLREVVIEAIRRHMTYPSPLPEPPAPVPLPDVPKRPRGRPKKKS